MTTTTFSSHPECDRCVRTEDGYWCKTHIAPIGDSSDGWAGCTLAIVLDVRALADEFERREAEAQALVETDYPAYEAAQLGMIGLGMRLSGLLIRDEQERADD